MDLPFYIIAAVDSSNGIGKNGDLPWRLKEDLQHFQDVTTEVENEGKKNMVIMGRRTWESLPASSRPLKGRRNVVLTNQENYEAEGAEVVASLEAAMSLADSEIESIFVIGGGVLYREAILRDDLNGVYLTRVKGDFECDTFFPDLPEHLDTEVYLGDGEDRGVKYQFLLYVKE